HLSDTQVLSLTITHTHTCTSAHLPIVHLHLLTDVLYPSLLHLHIHTHTHTHSRTLSLSHTHTHTHTQRHTQHTLKDTPKYGALIVLQGPWCLLVHCSTDQGEPPGEEVALPSQTQHAGKQ